MQTETLQQNETFLDGLPVGSTLLLGQYRIEQELVRGGFGITYLARDSLDRQVVVKECFAEAICLRHQNKIHANSSENQTQFARIRKHFLREARRMAKLSHPNIVGVHQVFEENNTAYMVLDHVKGMDLLTMMDTAPERLTPALVRTMLLRCLDAIGFVHAEGLLHGDISPDNVMLTYNGNLQLIDFGSAQEQVSEDAAAPSRILSVKDGYSPQEFYSTEEAHTPASDLYALGATIHHLVTGEAPPHSLSRIKAIATVGKDCYRPLAGRVTGYDKSFLAAIDAALALYPEDRPQTARDWMARIVPAAEIESEIAPARGAEAFAAENNPDAAAAAASSGPLAPATPARDGDILRVISALVADVNEDITPAHPRRPQPAAAAAEQPGDSAPAQLVDLFGNPIHDVDAWLDEQSRAARQRTSFLGRQAGHTAPRTTPTSQPRGLRKLMRRLMLSWGDQLTNNAC